MLQAGHILYKQGKYQIEANETPPDLLSYRFHLSLPRKLPLTLNPLDFPENNIGFLSLLARSLVLRCPFTQNRYHTVGFLGVLPCEYHRKLALDRGTCTTGISEACIELIVVEDVVVDPSVVRG